MRELRGTSVDAGAQHLVGAIDAERLDLDAYLAFGGLDDGFFDDLE